MQTVRARRLQVYEHRYTPLGQIGDPCTYCGAPSESMDHIPPIWSCTSLADDHIPHDPSHFVKVPACQQCNSHLGGKMFLTVAERRRSVRSYLRSKYARLLRMPLWDEDELAEMSPIFAQHIRACSHEVERIRRRIAATFGTTDRKS